MDYERMKIDDLAALCRERNLFADDESPYDFTRKHLIAQLEKSDRTAQGDASGATESYTAVCDAPGHVLLRMPGLDLGMDAEKALLFAGKIIAAAKEALPHCGPRE